MQHTGITTRSNNGFVGKTPRTVAHELVYQLSFDFEFLNAGFNHFSNPAKSFVCNVASALNLRYFFLCLYRPDGMHDRCAPLVLMKRISAADPFTKTVFFGFHRQYCAGLLITVEVNYGGFGHQCMQN